MKKNVKKFCVGCAATALMVMCIPGYAASPGSSDDPLVSMSYVNEVLIPQVQSYVDSKVAAIDTNTPQNQVPGANFNVVNVSKGQTIIGGKSCQIILRMGSGTIIASQKGGLADVTAGIDLGTGVAIPANHLLIIPVDDWRGVKMDTDGILMISGNYSVH